MWQPLQVDHKSGSKYSDMQTAEKKMAEWMGIEVLEFKFNETEVSKIDIKGEKDEARDETAFKQRLGDFLLQHGVADDMPMPTYEDSDEDKDEDEDEDESSSRSSSSS